MKTINFLILLISLLIVISSCERKDVDIFIIEGQITDDISNQPIEGVEIRVDAIKSSSGMGIISNGKRKTVGKATTDRNGYYKAKLKVFNGAQRLEISINENNKKEGYADGYLDASLSTLNKGASTIFNHAISPTAILKIKFINTSPQSNADKFILNWCNCGQGLTKGIINRENCGTVKESEGGQWIGEDVCGVYTIEAVAGRKSDFSWYVTKNNETRLFLDSVFVARGVLNEFLINY
ncbi:carboxypeptidase regulatory-like domain-containing protein [Pontibacter russatus]|uniref:carboxypeptidase regulatory-like domain-containing protein n=1 Tax=Pontibacter russatus TaxID=2694929 RepID=UPI00137B1D57|nr:carboxypeptidase regulatory-like domain-containing protein [Pontibacter russatus]